MKVAKIVGKVATAVVVVIIEAAFVVIVEAVVVVVEKIIIDYQIDDFADNLILKYSI